MEVTAWVLVIATVVDLLLLVAILATPTLRTGRASRWLFVVAALALPVLTSAGAANLAVQRAQRVDFCVSCHEMEPYGGSLTVDDDELLPAAHFQNRRVSRETACYDCHTDYTMFGGLDGKIRGLRHVYVHYLGTVPERLSLYSPYQNRECLHCHEGARSFEEASAHRRTADALAKMKQGATSCLESGCHDLAHDIHQEPEADE